MEFSERCRPIELLLSDVDGVLTDGGIVFDNQGVEIKRFHIHDGLGVKLWQRAGYRFGMITGRSSHIVKLRAAELGVSLVRQGFETKLLKSGGFSVSYRTGQSSVEQVLAAIRASGLHIKDISTEDPDLEDVFVSLTSSAAA